MFIEHTVFTPDVEIYSTILLFAGFIFTFAIALATAMILKFWWEEKSKFPFAFLLAIIPMALFIGASMGANAIMANWNNNPEHIKYSANGKIVETSWNDDSTESNLLLDIVLTSAYEETTTTFTIPVEKYPTVITDGIKKAMDAEEYQDSLDGQLVTFRCDDITENDEGKLDACEINPDKL